MKVEVKDDRTAHVRIAWDLTDRVREQVKAELGVPVSMSVAVEKALEAYIRRNPNHQTGL